MAKTMEVKCKNSGETILIKQCRFNPELHEQLNGEKVSTENTCVDECTVEKVDTIQIEDKDTLICEIKALDAETKATKRWSVKRLSEELCNLKGE